MKPDVHTFMSGQSVISCIVASLKTCHDNNYIESPHFLGQTSEILLLVGLNWGLMEFRF